MEPSNNRNNQLMAYRLDMLENAVESIGDAMTVFQEFMLSAKVWAKVGAVVATVIFGVVQPVVVALIVMKLGG